MMQGTPQLQIDAKSGVNTVIRFTFPYSATAQRDISVRTKGGFKVLCVFHWFEHLIYFSVMEYFWK